MNTRFLYTVSIQEIAVDVNPNYIGYTKIAKPPAM